MTPPDPACIAAGLTSDMRDVLLAFSGDPEDMAEPVTPAGGYDREMVARHRPRLVERELVFRIWRLTPLGRAVRAALADARGAVGGNPDDGEDA